MIGSLGFTEILFILGLALLIFGPRKLPEIGRTIGRSLAEFRKASTDLKRSLNAEMIEEEMRESDPRRILEDDPPAASGRKNEAGESKPDSAGSEPAAGEALAPEGSVPRGADVDAAAETSTESEAR